jgi:hypothetical protein
MRPADVVKLRLHAQCIATTTFTRPAEVVAWLGAVQAQDYLGALWAVGLRLARARERDVEKALADRSIVRTWPMRGTLHFVAAADARWMLELLAPRMVTRSAGRFRALGLDEPTLGRARRVLSKRLAGGPVTRPAVYESLARAGIAPTGQRGIHILWRLAHDCLLCFGPRAGKQQTFVLFDEWLPRAKRLPRDEALAELASRYFASHGPATVADLAWWSGLRLQDAKAAIERAGKRLDQEILGGSAYWFARASAPARAPRSHAHLLPAFDEFLVAYVDRSAALDPRHRTRVNAGGGILHPTIVLGNQVVGTWKRRLTREEVVFSPTPFLTLGAPGERLVTRALAKYGEFLGVRARRET